jgi:hypothetical protein
MSTLASIEVKVSVSTGIKCPRCWHFHHVTENYDNLCDRCHNVESSNSTETKKAISDSLKQQRMKYCIRHDKSTCKHEFCCMEVKE